MTFPITMQDVLAAQRRIRLYLPPTPLRRYRALDEAVGAAAVWVKHENHHPTNAF
jgi:threonine dehydratase